MTITTIYFICSISVVPETQIIPKTQQQSSKLDYLSDLTDDEGFTLAVSHWFKRTWHRTKALAERMKQIEEEFATSEDDAKMSDEGKRIV